MPIADAAHERTPIHARRVLCDGFRRADGLWDIEGRVIDTKAYDFSNHDRGRIATGDPLHDMSLRLTLDDDYVIVAAQAATDKAPYRICPAITTNFERLAGLRIGPGFLRQVRRLLGGTEGCTHLVELLGPMATTAFQTIGPILSKERAAGTGEEGERRGKPALLGSCHAYAPGSEVVARLWPECAESEGAGGDTQEGF